MVEHQGQHGQGYSLHYACCQLRAYPIAACILQPQILQEPSSAGHLYDCNPHSSMSATSGERAQAFEQQPRVCSFSGFASYLDLLR